MGGGTGVESRKKRKKATMPNFLADACDQLDRVEIAKHSSSSIDRDFELFQSYSRSMDDIQLEQHDPKRMQQHDIMDPQPQSDLDTYDTANPDENDLPPFEPHNHNHDTHRYVTPKDFELLKVIGMGAFGKVLQVRNKQSQQLLAMKVISKRLLKKKGEGLMENIVAERNILTKVSHNFIVKFHCSFQTREKLFIIMDFLAGGELFLKIGKEGIFLEKTASFYLAEIILALDHLHNLGILHRDLKPENILLGKDGHICLTDFGLAKDFGSRNTSPDSEDDVFAMTICGTQEYMAPEMIAKRGYGRAADYWSLGCIAYEMLSGFPPFDSRKGSKELFRKIMSERVKMPQGCSAAACKLLKGLLNRNVQARLGTARSTMFEVGGVAGLKQQEIFRNIVDWDKLANKQIDPPMTVSVNDDQDVQHFYDEFTNMALPKSVYDMCTDDNFQPRHVQSGMFRGFSFIASDFVLPDRNISEQRAYWESVEEDGESVSECASSKIMMTSNTDEAGLDEPLVTTTTTLAVKKRPPRKRKKKMVTAANTPDVSATNTPEPSELGDTIDMMHAVVLDDKQADKGHVSNENLKIPTASATTTKTTILGSSSGEKPVESSSSMVPSIPKPLAPETPKPQPEVWLTSSNKKTPDKGNHLSTITRGSPVRQQAAVSAWSLNNRQQQSTSNGGTSWSSVATSSSSSKRREGQAQQSSQKSWNTIVGRVQNSPLTQQKVPEGAAQKQLSPRVSTAPPPKHTVSPSSDWRNHHMSPRDNAGRPAVRVPPPSTGQSSWPSLTPPLSVTASTKTRPQASQGVWGVKKS